jgi:Domain of unknown function (DUF5134)
MIESAAARWLFTAVFAAAALGAVLSRRRAAGPGRGDRAGAGFCLVMCAALIAMAWWAEPAAVVWVQVAGFGCAALCFGLAGAGRSGLGSGWFGRPSLTGLHHALMAVAMIWMLTALPSAAGMRPAGRDPGAMAGMPSAGAMPGSAAMPGAAGLPGPVLAVSVLCAACCAGAALPWLARAIGPGAAVRDPAAAGQAVMSAGMAAMLIAML